MIIATLPPYVDHRAEIIAHPAVGALRFNTISPLAEPRIDVLKRLAAECGDKPLWVDLKGRQLRITKFAYLPFAYVELNHQIRVNVPTRMSFEDGEARVDAVVDGRKLILSERPWRVLGDGEPVNILDPSLEILDPMPASDLAYLEAARALGLRRFMLSFVESPEDVERVRASVPDAEIVAKIESRRGMAQVGRLPGRLMAARQDLYVQLSDEILPALRAIIAVDPEAIVASRILESLLGGEQPTLADLSDLELMREMGYRTMMLGDGLCFRRDPFRRAMKFLG